jgi:catechol 2,3-dioxygenase-like lactoylglutathione lyase family enzyme
MIYKDVLLRYVFFAIKSGLIDDIVLISYKQEAIFLNLQLELFVRDLEDSIYFYSQILGLPIIEKRKYLVSYQLGNSTLMIAEDQILNEKHYFDHDSLKKRKGVGIEIILQVSDIYAIYQKILGEKYPIAVPLKRRSWGSIDFRVADPDGYFIRITN